MDGTISTGQSILGSNMYVYTDNNFVNKIDLDGDAWYDIFGSVYNWAKGAVFGAINYVVDTVTAPFKLVHNLVTDFHSTIDAIRRGITIAVVTGNMNPEKIIKNKMNKVIDATINGTSYDAGYSLGYELAGPALVMSTPYLFDRSVKSSKIFGGNDGHGFKLGDRTEILYRNPSFVENYGVPGGTFISMKKKNGDRLIRIDWDLKDGYHIHPPTRRK